MAGNATPDHECSPANCYPGCGHGCLEGRGVIAGLMKRRGKGATGDELFAAQPGGKTERLLLGDRGKTDNLMVSDTLDALVNKIKGRKLGNKRNPMMRDQLMSSTRAMQRGEVEDGAAFEHVERSVAAKGAHDPAALAAWIGRRAEGKKKFQAKAAAGHRAHDDLPTVMNPPLSSSGGKTVTTPHDAPGGSGIPDSGDLATALAPTPDRARRRR